MIYSTDNDTYQGCPDFFFEFSNGTLHLVMPQEEDYPQIREAHMMQFINYNDVKGIEIYEDDVVEYMEQIKNYEDEDSVNPRYYNVPQYTTVKRRGRVVYDPAIFRLVDKNGLLDTGYPNWDRCTVVGNIHEDPDLL
jgi:uncharacterized phage protein (TIGR01671 family)